MNKVLASSIPTSPGIYIMKDSSKNVIYVGKAKNLRNRVRSYFLQKQDWKTQRLVANIDDIEFVVTDNESEAFLLESNMIKKYRPRFNIELKDQQRYTYLRITDEKYPRLVVARRTRSGKFLGKGKIFGPFTYGSSKLLTIGSLRKAFKIRICKKLPKKACLEYHLGNCEAPCEFPLAQQRYQKHVADLEDVLRGKDQTSAFVEKLKEEMAEASDLQHFERAIEIRDTLSRLESLQIKQKMEYVENSDEEYFGIKIKNQTAIVMSFRVLNGVIRDSERFEFDYMADNTFSNFIFQYYETRKIPAYVYTSEMPSDKRMLESLLSKRANRKVRIMVPKRGKKFDLINLLMKNISLNHLHKTNPALSELKETLNLEKIPVVIECFDISNHGDDYAVGAMSRFVDGQPDKSGYRRFRIKRVNSRNDFAMMGEIVSRRYSRLKKEGTMPDLILIDGGRGQLNIVLRSLQNLGVRLPCVSIAKENEELFAPHLQKPIQLPKTNSSLKILQYARDEAHRFGVRYNRTLRNTHNLNKN